jgi:hypothetical protein
MTDKVTFIPFQGPNDLRNVLASHTAPAHDVYAVAYRTQYGEVRVINWLTLAEANRRAALLKGRGYKIVVGLMDHAA